MAPLAIAHRGLWWPEPAQQNTTRAFEAAAKAGYGLELDVWHTLGGPLAVCHRPDDRPDFYLDGTAPLPALCAAPLLAWNLKSLAAAEPLAKFIRQHGLEGVSVVFDHELVAQEAGMPPHHGARVLEKCGCPGILTRASDLAKEHLGFALVGPGMGVWLDCFRKDWVTAETIRTVHAAKKAAYVVSPELHGRPLDLGLWKAWAEADGICTDFPHLLAAMTPSGPGGMALQRDAPLEPVDPWWAP